MLKKPRICILRLVAEKAFGVHL